jgi:hypothetical protein
MGDGPAGSGEDDGLDSLMLDTAVRAHGPAVVTCLVIAAAVPGVVASGLIVGWWAVGAVIGAIALASRWLVGRAGDIDRDLAAVLDEP